MSLHALIDGCGHRDTSRGREVFWCGLCECGWEGAEHSGSHAADYARRDYRQHVEEALGAEAYYTATVGCKNCGSVHEQGVLVGTAVYQNACQRCGTRMLQPSNEIWDEAREHSKGWFR